jgi:DNA modification methylase
MIELIKSELIPIKKLVNNNGQIEGLPKNPRIIKDHKYLKLKASIEENPEFLGARELLVYAHENNFVILAGNMRFKVAQELNFKEIPCKIIPSSFTIDQLKAIVIKDNISYGSEDWDALANEWDVEKLDEWGLDLPVDLSLKEELEAEEDDYEIPNEINTDIVLGDLFEIGEHRLLCGDSTDSDQVARLMNGEKADMVFTDPPYGMFLNTEYKDSFGDNGFRKAKNYSNVIGDNEDFKPELINTIFACFDYCQEIFIWGADYFAELIPKKNDGMFGNQFELCWSKNKHKRIIIDVTWAGAFGHNKITDGATKVHPTQKPIKLIDIFITDFSKEKDLISDLFLGSGSTMVASHQLKRKCYGMELDPKYCQVIIDRMKKLDPSLVIKRN